MKIAEAIKTIMKAKKVTQMKLAEETGYKGQSSVATRLRGDMQMSTAYKMLEALDYEIVIQPKSTRGKRANGAYVIDMEGGEEK